MADESVVTVAGLHALIYCERLFYLEEVERIRVADARVYAGRRLHVEIGAAPIDEDGPLERRLLESEQLGVQGAVDVVRRRDGRLVPYEHKRGRSAGSKGARQAWDTDLIQIGAYALLVEESTGQSVDEGRVRYHADQVTVRVPIDETLRARVRTAIARAQEVRRSTQRPPVTSEERRCERCSLASVCLPEEARLAADPEFRPLRLVPQIPDRQTLHVAANPARVGRASEELVVTAKDQPPVRTPIGEVGQVVLHGFAQISTQALRLCADHDVGVHWMTMGGGLVGSLAPTAVAAQRHLRQFEALAHEERCVALARRLVRGKLEGQLRYLLRASRGLPRTESLLGAVARIRASLRALRSAADRSELLGIEGGGTAAYFGVMSELISADADERLRFQRRTRKPPRDRLNCLLSYGYGMLYRETVQAIIAAGLHAGMGFYHRPRSAAQTLALDIEELFRVPIVDIAIIAAINRRTFDADTDFIEVGDRVNLTDSGRRKIIDVIERRKQDRWRHSVVGYSISYARMIELEVRLLEKEWMSEGGLFARFRIR